MKTIKEITTALKEATQIEPWMEAIQQDERYIRFAKARLANDDDADLQNAIGNFNIKRMELEKAVSEENKVPCIFSCP